MKKLLRDLDNANIALGHLLLAIRSIAVYRIIGSTLPKSKKEGVFSVLFNGNRLK